MSFCETGGARGLGGYRVMRWFRRAALGDLSKNDPALRLVDDQLKSIQKISSTQDEQSFVSVQKQTTDVEFDIFNPYRHVPQPRPHTTLLHPHDLRLGTCVPIHTDLASQAVRCERKVCSRVYQKPIGSIPGKSLDRNRDFGIADWPKGGDFLQQWEFNRHKQYWQARCTR